jgi:uncharacterized protein (DUF433 family)
MPKEYIEQRDGGYYIAGTRVSLDSSVYAFARGESPETICQNFEVLEREEVYRAIAYYLASQTTHDDYLNRQDKKWTAGKRGSEALPADLRAMLIRAREQMRQEPCRQPSGIGDNCVRRTAN